YSRVEKMYFLGRRQKANSVSQHVLGKRRGRRKLSEAVSLGLRLLAIQFGLKCDTLLFENVDWLPHGSESKKDQVVSAVFPHPVDTLGGLVTGVSAIKVAAQKKVELNLIAVGAAKLRHFDGFLLSALVGVRK